MQRLHALLNAAAILRAGRSYTDEDAVTAAYKLYDLIAVREMEALKSTLAEAKASLIAEIEKGHNECNKELPPQKNNQSA